MGKPNNEKNTRSKKRRPDTITVENIKFQFGKVTWQDAFSSYRVPTLTAMDWARRTHFPTRETYGYYAKIDQVVLVFKEIGSDRVDMDITVIPLSPKVTFKSR